MEWGQCFFLRKWWVFCGGFFIFEGWFWVEVVNNVGWLLKCVLVLLFSLARVRVYLL